MDKHIIPILKVKEESEDHHVHTQTVDVTSAEQVKEQYVVSEDSGKEDAKPILENVRTKAINVKEESRPITTLILPEDVKQERTESNNPYVVNTECECFNDSHADVKHWCNNSNNTVKQEVPGRSTYTGIIIGKTEDRVGDGEEMSAALMLGEDHVTGTTVSSTGEMQLQISSDKSLNNFGDITSTPAYTADPALESKVSEEALMITSAEDFHAEKILDEETGCSSNESCTKGVSSHHPCPPVIDHRAAQDSSSGAKHGGLERQRADASDKPYRCVDCGAGFTQSGRLLSHVRQHRGEKPYKCELCEARFSRSDHLQCHRRTHTGEKPYKCRFCDAKFAQSNNLHKHERTHTGVKSYKCEFCGNAFTWASQLQTHKQKHTGGKPFKCEVCGALFARETHLKNHRRTHTGEKPYKCDSCGVGFAERGNLHKHTRTHAGEKPYKCDSCDTSFVERSNLRKHKRTHTGEKSYTCEVCGDAFTWASQLQTHQRKHTGEKPFKCEECEAQYAHKKSLQRHARFHSGEKLDKV